jgi:CHAD domain-containing protein
MSFELRLDKSLRKNVRRIARKQMDGALEVLTRARKRPRDEAVHEARKAFKKLRAVLRLVRPEIGERIYREENTWFRDAARPLTEVRDAKILVDTLDNLIRNFREHVDGRSFANVKNALEANLQAVRKRVLVEQNAFAKAAAAVRQAKKRIKAWTDVRDKWPAVGKGLIDTYRRSARAFREVDADPAAETLHEWRKQAKYLYYQLQILTPLWPERMAELANEADRMGELLGDDHDLTVLRQTLTEGVGQLGDETDVEVLLALIDRRRAELEQEAMTLGQRFFQDRPRDFGRRLKGYWKTWRAQAAPTDAQRSPVHMA